MEEIDSVPELEALLLLRQHRCNSWTAIELAKRLYIDPEQTRALLAELNRKQLVQFISGEPEACCYQPRSPETDAVIARVEAVYRHEIVRISTLIHAKPSAAIRDFARAFRFTKEK